MATIPLGRRFNEWYGDTYQALARRRKARVHKTPTWSDLLVTRRVVILAEAGSCKTAGFIAQVSLQIAAGKTTFYASHRDLKFRAEENDTVLTSDQRRVYQRQAAHVMSYHMLVR